MNIFKPENFEAVCYVSMPIEKYCKELADHTNRILTEWIEKNGKKVYGVIDPSHEDGKDFIMGTTNDMTDTHQAILIDIQEIVKKPCEHKKMSDVGIVDYGVEGVCAKCGVKLKARWEVYE